MRIVIDTGAGDPVVVQSSAPNAASQPNAGAVDQTSPSAKLPVHDGGAAPERSGTTALPGATTDATTSTATNAGAGPTL